MTTQLTVVDNTVKSLVALTSGTKESIRKAMDQNYLKALVSQYPQLSQMDFITFINKAQLVGADPRLDQIYLMVNNQKNKLTNNYEPKGTTVFSYHFFILKARETGDLEDFGVDTNVDVYVDVVSGQERKSITSVAWVKRKSGGRYEYKARFWELAKLTKDGQLFQKWRESPYMMLEKCAVANVMRWAFPEAVGGMYIQEEIQKEDHQTIDVKADYMPSQNVETRTLPEAKGRTVEEIKKPKTEEDEVVKETPKIDFSGRDIEDLREELVDYLVKASPSLFEKMGKTKEYMIEKVEAEKNIEGMKQKYSIIMRFI